jgi:hypothetical protein
MAKSILNLPGSIGIYRFQITIGTPSFSVNHQQLVIPYTTYGNTALVADLTTYQFSLDGSTWTTMTAAVGTVVSNLNFTPTGTAQTFTWEIKSDLPSGIYNKNIYIRLQATSGTMVTTMLNYTAYFTKEVANEAASAKNKLPDDYTGISGSDLLENAPKGN